MRPSTGPVLSALLGALLLTGMGLGCRATPSRRPPIHPNPNMDIQPKLRPQAASEFFYNGAVMQPPPPGTVARGRLDDDDAIHTGRGPRGEPLLTSPVEVTTALLDRGAERYGIYCRPCHGAGGSGGGTVMRRAGIESADLLAAEVAAYSEGRLFEIISDGSGLMPGYRHPIPAADRWAIVAHLRRLQAEAK